jgi:hypothetical protein
MKNLTELESSVLQDALTEYAVMLRTIKSPCDEDRTMSEELFLTSGISPVRKQRYLTALGLRAEVKANCVKLV